LFVGAIATIRCRPPLRRLATTALDEPSVTGAAKKLCQGLREDLEMMMRSARCLVMRLAEPLKRIRGGRALRALLLSTVVLVLLSAGSFAEDVALARAPTDQQKALGETIAPAAPAVSAEPDHAGNAASPSPVAASSAAAPSVVSASTGPNVGPLPDELSPWGMFLHADIVVKAVIIGLALASVATWTVLMVKTVQLRLARRAAHRACATLMSSLSLFGAITQLAGQRSAVIRLVAAAEDELDRSRDLSAEGIKERVAWELERLQATAARQIGRGMGVLATIGAVAPFIGLFGTVWGIMNSFVGISRAHTTNLAVVAPGIAEALLATAFGLIAAIPAVVIYNVFVRSIGGYRADLTDASVAILRLLSRDLERDDRALDVRRGPRAADAPALSIAQSAE
jgi:biopolymer transport protein ExbB